MFESLLNYLKRWNKETEARAKLQQTYLIAAVGIVAVAGIIGLFDAQVGRTIASFAGGALLIFLINAVVWALLQSITTSYLAGKRSIRK